MKKMRYLLLLILFIPIVVLAEPIHLTQADIEEAFTNRGTEIQNTGIKFVFDYYSTGFVLSREEYILDEDIDLHKGFMTPATSDLVVINLNGHSINQNLDVYSGKNTTCTIRDLWETTAVVNMTINGPGTIGRAQNVSTNNVNVHGGTVTFNNVDVKGTVRASNNNALSVINFNNSNLEGRFEMWHSDLNIDGGKFGYDENSVYNSLYGSNAVINNATIDVINNNGLDIQSDSGVYSKATITNSTISGGPDSIYITNGCELKLYNSELIGDSVGGWYNIYLGGTPTIELADVHMYTKREINGPHVMQIQGDDGTAPEDAFARFLKEGYIYYNNPTYASGSSYSAMVNKEIWIIKQQEEYEAEEQTYEIPEDNEVIIKVSGYKFLFEKLIINNEEVPDTDYEILDTDGDKDVSIKIKNDYLKTLEANKYDIEVVFTNGSATTTLNVVDEEPVSNEVPEVKGEEENPKTGVHNYLILLIPIVVLGIVYLYTIKKTLFKI